MRPVLILAAAIALSGCQTTRYVKTPCISAEQYKQLEQSEPEKVKPKLTGNAGEDIKIISGSAVRLRAWGRGNLQILSGCIG